MTNERVLKNFYYLGLLVIILYLVYLIRTILLPFALGGILAYALTPAAYYLNRRGLSWKASVLIIFLALLVFFLILFFLVIPESIDQFRTLASNLPVYTEQIISITQAIDERYPGLNISEAVESFLVDFSENIQAYLTGILRNVVDLVSLIVSVLFFGFILAPFILYYFLVDTVKIRRALVKLFPRKKRKEYITLLREIEHILGAFIRGRLLICLFVGASVSLSMLFLGIEFPLVIGLIAGIADIVPYLGPIMGAIPALLFAATKSTSTLILVAVMFGLINLIEAIIVVPKLMGKETGLHPLTVLFALMVGEQLYGPLGLILAIPIAGIIKALLRVYRKKPHGELP
ncbi:MAG TPA: AI-2E family transporter [Atribacteraceae bacterium]|nr:AI-2E family transporter [Atribacteraceae bacterium]